mmetsp:Transcript_24883/g.44324  ORF Transcript_24883/g.44324 Transcript_24883/m.44324 type:complete len:334 (+) Transcript_24883:492-1493(+)
MPLLDGIQRTLQSRRAKEAQNDEGGASHEEVLRTLHKRLGEDFFKDTERVTRVFENSARDVLLAASMMGQAKWRRTTSRNVAALLAPLRPSKFPRPFRFIIGKQAQDVHAAANVCLQWCSSNRDAVRGFEAAYRSATGSATSAARMVAPCWANERVGGFLTSPLLLELRALLQAQSVPEGEEVPEVSCPICLCALFRPVGLVCGHAFCSHCLRGSLEARRCSTTEVSGSAPSVEVCCPHCRRMSRLDAAVEMPRLEALARTVSPEEWAEQQEQHRLELAAAELERQEAMARRLREGFGRDFAGCLRPPASMHGLFSGLGPLSVQDAIITFGMC